MNSATGSVFIQQKREIVMVVGDEVVCFFLCLKKKYLQAYLKDGKNNLLKKENVKIYNRGRQLTCKSLRLSESIENNAREGLTLDRRRVPPTVYGKGRVCTQKHVG